MNDMNKILSNIKDKTQEVVNNTKSMKVEQEEFPNSNRKESTSSDELIDNTTSIEKYDKSLLEDLLDARLPNWPELKRKTDEIVNQEPPQGIVNWIENSLSIKKNHFKNGWMSLH